MHRQRLQAIARHNGQTPYDKPYYHVNSAPSPAVSKPKIAFGWALSFAILSSELLLCIRKIALESKFGPSASAASEKELLEGIAISGLQLPLYYLLSRLCGLDRWVSTRVSIIAGAFIMFIYITSGSIASSYQILSNIF